MESASEQVDLIDWGSPIPVFGQLASATIATVGLNPSNREFVDNDGRELVGELRRFHTLASLGLISWQEADSWHLRWLVESYESYFQKNPYDGWFRRLDNVLAKSGATYYGSDSNACHLDLIPFATTNKWMALSRDQRSKLLDLSRDVLAILVRDSPIEVIVLNGQSVVDEFESISGKNLAKEEIKDASLPRSGGKDIKAYGYFGFVNSFSDTPLGKDVLVLGYNHNLQSSFGVTNTAMNAISKWLGQKVAGLRK